MFDCILDDNVGVSLKFGGWMIDVQVAMVYELISIVNLCHISYD